MGPLNPLRLGSISRSTRQLRTASSSCTTFDIAGSSPSSTTAPRVPLIRGPALLLQKNGSSLSLGPISSNRQRPPAAPHPAITITRYHSTGTMGPSVSQGAQTVSAVPESYTTTPQWQQSAFTPGLATAVVPNAALLSGQQDEGVLADIEQLGQDSSNNKEEEPELPPLTPAEFKQYNRLAERMEYFHENFFRTTWTMLYTAASSNRRPQGMSLKQFVNEGLNFIQNLTSHHMIEESSIFPVLARKMPEFSAGGAGGAAELLRQHKQIHVGMDGFESYLRKCVRGETELEMAALKTQMDGWGEVLWKHLDQEVETLRAENMRKYWTVEEMRRLPM